jgi:hypothetical protein
MNEEDRKKLVDNLVELVEQTNLKVLIPELLKRKVFTLEMIQKYTVSYSLWISFILETFRLSHHFDGICIDVLGDSTLLCCTDFFTVSENLEEPE